MIQGIGIDLVDIKRIEKSLEQGNRFVNRILTEKEKTIYIHLRSKRRQLEYIAGRFAAKEAFSKAVGTGIGELSFQDIEIFNEDTGAPYLEVKGFTKNKLFISISHSEDYATAQVIIEK